VGALGVAGMFFLALDFPFPEVCPLWIRLPVWLRCGVL
jgi:hypothetical protein